MDELLDSSGERLKEASADTAGQGTSQVLEARAVLNKEQQFVNVLPR